MFHTRSLRQQRIARWTVGLVIAVALATSSLAFVTFDGLSLPRVQQSAIAPAESVSDAPVSGPYELYHTQGAPTAIRNQGTPDGAFQTPWERYHCTGCP